MFDSVPDLRAVLDRLVSLDFACCVSLTLCCCDGGDECDVVVSGAFAYVFVYLQFAVEVFLWIAGKGVDHLKSEFDASFLSYTKCLIALDKCVFFLNSPSFVGTHRHCYLGFCDG